MTHSSRPLNDRGSCGLSPEKQKRRNQLIQLIVSHGYPKEFGIVLADELKTEKQMTRMIGYLLSAHPTRIEDIVDEMLAIKADFASYRQKKITEHNNSAYNDLLNRGLEVSDSETQKS